MSQTIVSPLDDVKAFAEQAKARVLAPWHMQHPVPQQQQPKPSMLGGINLQPIIGQALQSVMKGEKLDAKALLAGVVPQMMGGVIAPGAPGQSPQAAQLMGLLNAQLAQLGLRPDSPPAVVRATILDRLGKPGDPLREKAEALVKAKESGSDIAPMLKDMFPPDHPAMLPLLGALGTVQAPAAVPAAPALFNPATANVPTPTGSVQVPDRWAAVEAYRAEVTQLRAEVKGLHSLTTDALEAMRTHTELLHQLHGMLKSIPDVLLELLLASQPPTFFQPSTTASPPTQATASAVVDAETKGREAA